MTASDFFWLVNSDHPDDWSVVAREEGGEWHEHRMSMSEFTFRMLTDATCEDFTIAHLVDPPYYEPA